VTTLTRIQIADLIADAFGPGGTDRSTLLAVAAEKGAHPALLQKLGALPDQRFRTMRDLWDHIPEVPLD
jgi:hypothetical protein